MITKLVCKKFRSYSSLSLSFRSKIVVFFGENGAGKTNILEAISLFSQGKGFRKAQLFEMIFQNETHTNSKIEMVVSTDLCQFFLETNVDNVRRTAKIDSTIVTSLAKIEEVLWLLWIVPSMDNVFMSNGSERRTFMDHLVNGYNKTHKTSLKKLNTLQKERINVMHERYDNDWLDVLEEQISLESIKITNARLEFIETLHRMFDEYSSFFLRPKVSIFGEFESVIRRFSEENAVLELKQMLKIARRQDCERQYSSIGVHKTLWNIVHPINKFDAENCSSGEQKAFLVSLMLAAVRVYKLTNTGVPILLLDDVMTHLDSGRRKALAEELISLDVQVFITGTDQHLFSDLITNADIYNVSRSICTIAKRVYQ